MMFLKAGRGQRRDLCAGAPPNKEKRRRRPVSSLNDLGAEASLALDDAAHSPKEWGRHRPLAMILGFRIVSRDFRVSCS